MKRQLSSLIYVSFLAVAACGNRGSNGENNAQNQTGADTLAAYDSATMVKDPTDTTSNYPTTFAVKAGAGGMLEVQLGTLAQQNAQNARVKEFGAMMVRDHSKANKELMTIAAGKNITIPSTLPEDHQKHLREMKKLKGAEFDEHYMDMMVDDHKEDIDLFTKGAKNLQDPELKAFASKTLPILNTHLDSAKAIRSALK